LIEEYTHPEMSFLKSGQKMVLDVYVPSLKLAFEYQGHHHYHDSTMFGIAKSQKRRDDEKQTACKSLGITLIEVPYWLQRNKESIAALLHNHIPDIMQSPSY